MVEEKTEAPHLSRPGLVYPKALACSLACSPMIVSRVHRKQRPLAQERARSRSQIGFSRLGHNRSALPAAHKSRARGHK